VAERFEQHRFAVPEGATEVVLVRHGASAAAVPDEPFPLLDGHGDPPLSPEGERQAALVAARLAAEGAPDGLFVTPLARTRQTAAPLAAALGLEPVVVPDLREVHLGQWEAGEYRIRVQRRDPAALRALAEERWDALPGGEAMDAFAERVARGLAEVVAAVGADARAVAVVHGGVIGELCREATASRPFAFIHAENTSLTRLVVLPGRRSLLRSFNDTAHLD
jgi:probable phosphoglycerate mutase